MKKTSLSNISHKLLTLLLACLMLAVLIQSASAQIRPKIDPGVAIIDKIELVGPNAIIDSYNSTISAYSPDITTNTAVVTVNSISANAITLFSEASINGDVYTGPNSNIKQSVRLSMKSTITGTQNILTEKIVMPTIYTPNIAPFNETSQGGLVMNKDEQWTIDTSMHLDELSIKDNSILTIEGAVVILLDKDLTIGPNAQLQITPGSTLDLYVTGDCNITGQLNSLAQDPQALYLYVLGGDNVFETNGNAAVYSVLQNPDGNVVFSSDTQFFGRVKAKNLYSQGAIHIDLDSGFPASPNQTGGYLQLENLAGMELIADNIYELGWTTDGDVDNVIIEYSDDTGETWTTVDTVINTGSYLWQIPPISSQDCYLRVLDAADPTSGVVSDQFTIYVCSLIFDLNGDCKVDEEDARLMAAEWLKCGNPFNPDCD